MFDQQVANNYEAKVRTALNDIGIGINGENPWDVQVRDPRAYRSFWKGGMLGIGEAYMDGWWDCSDLPELVNKAFHGGIRKKLPRTLAVMCSYLPQLVNRARWFPFEIGKAHYDIGNELYEHMLGQTMAYTCACWIPGVETLGGAQEEKLRLTCEKLHLREGMNVLDVGGGWGSLANYMAEHYGVNVVVTTVSEKQFYYMHRNLNHSYIKPRLQDWRDTPREEKYDRIVSLGMFEHVGYRNYKKFFHTMRRTLFDDGLMLLHTIGSPTTVHTADPWIAKYIFPNSMVPSQDQIYHAAGNDFFIKDWHEWPEYFYEKTLLMWHKNISAAWSELDHDKYFDKCFQRMWEYYLCSMIGAFRAERLKLWQIALTPGYEAYTPVGTDFGKRLINE